MVGIDKRAKHERRQKMKPWFKNKSKKCRKKLEQLRKTAKRTNGTVYQHIGLSVVEAKDINKFKRKRLGTFGAASEVRKIDPKEWSLSAD